MLRPGGPSRDGKWIFPFFGFVARRKDSSLRWSAHFATRHLLKRLDKSRRLVHPYQFSSGMEIGGHSVSPFSACLIERDPEEIEASSPYPF